MPGVAINRYGDTINLPKETDVSLLTAKSQPCGAVVKVFAECKPPKAGTYRTGAGVYLLAIRPASGGTGLAPVSGLGNDLAGCNTRYLVEGVRFVLAELPLAEDVLNDTARLRNRAAYACFGVQQEAALAADPFGAPPAESTAIDTLRASGDLTTCSVPLALVYWTTGGVEFVDTWAARRRAARRTAPIGTWDAATDWRRVAQAEARLQQFQQHVRMLLDETSQPGTLNAARCFRYLPPVGLLRIGGVRTDGLVIRPNASLPATAFNFDSFFGGRVHPAPVFIEGAHLAALVRDSIAFPPIDVECEEMVRL